MYTVEIGWKRGKYETKLTTESLSFALLHYSGYNVHSGGKKRLKFNGKVIERTITD